MNDQKNMRISHLALFILISYVDDKVYFVPLTIGLVAYVNLFDSTIAFYIFNRIDIFLYNALAFCLSQTESVS